jgi:hypothetical protein
MKAMLAALLTLSLVAGLAGQASAAAQRKHKQKAYSYRQAAPKSVSSRAAETEPSWYPHDSRLLPFGSQLWWRQMEREKGGSTRD